MELEKTVRGPELSEKERREANTLVITTLPGLEVVDYLPQNADENTESTTVYKFTDTV